MAKNKDIGLTPSDLLSRAIVHELRNPLNFILNFSALAKENAAEIAEKLAQIREGDPENTVLDELESLVLNQKTLSEKVHLHGKRAEAIIADLIHVNQLTEKQNLRAETLNKTLEKAAFYALEEISSKIQGFSPEIVFEFAATQSVKACSLTGLERSFINLSTNAFYALLEKRNSIAEKAKRLRLKISSKNTKGGIEIIFEDNGIGISLINLNRIFEPFYSDREGNQGTGLGLFLVQNFLVEKSGGNLSVEAEEGKFTRFRIELFS